MKYILALEINQTHIQTALFNEDGKGGGYAQRAIAPTYSRPEMLRQSSEHVYRMTEDCFFETLQATGIDKAEIAAVGVVTHNACKDDIIKQLKIENSVVTIVTEQQATLLGNRCFYKDMAQVSFREDALVLVNVGQVETDAPTGINKRPVWTIVNMPVHVLEGTVLSAGSTLEWLKDEIGFIQSFDELEPLANSIANTLGVYFVPALNGLGSPLWDSKARGLFIGLTRGTQRAHMVRAVLEGLAYQVKDVLDAMGYDQSKLSQLSIEGAGAMIDFVAQTLADVCQVNVIRPDNLYSNLTGAAYMAGLESGVWNALDDVNRLAFQYSQFQPSKNLSREYAKWKKAVQRAQG